MTEHLLTYLEGEERVELHAATEIKADINDWTITDLFGSSRNLAGSLATSNAALVVVKILSGWVKYRTEKPRLFGGALVYRFL